MGLFLVKMSVLIQAKQGNKPVIRVLEDKQLLWRRVYVRLMLNYK